MTVKILPFEAWHMYWMKIQDEKAGVLWPAFWAPEAAPMLETQNSWSLLTREGDVLASGGTMEQWPGRHVGWFHPSPCCGPYMRRVTKFGQMMLQDVKGRIETTVRADFAAGHRWAKLLGFEIENAPGLLKQYGPEGEDHIAYVRFN